MKIFLHSTFAMLCFSALPALAGQEVNAQFYEQAKVISVTPQVERVNTPARECHTDYERTSEPRSNTGAIIGGVAGGLLGSTIGRGNGKVAAAAIGAGVGAITGDRVDNQAQSSDRAVEHCVMVDHWQTVERGYLVTYDYNGHVLSTVSNTRPGETIAIRVSVAPSGSEDVVSYSELPPPSPESYPYRRHPHP